MFMVENRLLKLSIEHPELSECVDQIKSKQEFLKVLQKYMPDYTEDDFDKDLHDLKTLSDDDTSSVAVGAMKINSEMSDDFFQSVNDRVKKILMVCS